MSSKTTAKSAPVDWSLAPRGVVSGTAMTTAALVLTAGVGDLAHVHPVWAGLGAGVGGLAHLMATTHQARHTPGAVLYRLACWAGAGGWLTWALTGPANWHDTGGLAALAIGAIGVGIASPIASATRPQDAQGAAGGRAGTAVVLAGGGETGRAWTARIGRVSPISVDITQVVDYPTGTGYYVHALLPIGGNTSTTSPGTANPSRRTRGLPRGCAIAVEEATCRAR